MGLVWGRTWCRQEGQGGVSHTASCSAFGDLIQRYGNMLVLKLTSSLIE